MQRTLTKLVACSFVSLLAFYQPMCVRNFRGLFLPIPTLSDHSVNYNPHGTAVHLDKAQRESPFFCCNISNFSWAFGNIHWCDCSGQKTPDCSWGRLSKGLGNWGSGNSEGGGFGGGVGTGEVSLQATWDRGGQILSQLGGFQVIRRGLKGEQGETKENQQGESAMYIVIYARDIKNAWDVWMIPVVYIQ